MSDPAPSPALARETARERKREAVLEAAARMFNENGFHSTSLDDVAARLGVTKPVIYHYLGSKEQVLLGCLGRGHQELMAAAGQAARSPGPAIDKLRHFLELYVTVIADEFGRCVILTSDDELSAEGRLRFRAMKREIDQALRTLLREGVADGSIHAPDIRLTAFTLAGAVNWVARWYAPQGEMDPRQIARTLVGTLLAGVTPR